MTTYYTQNPTGSFKGNSDWQAIKMLFILTNLNLYFHNKKSKSSSL